MKLRGIEPLFGHRLDLRRDIVPGGAEPQHCAHALAHPRDRVRGGGALVVVGGAAGRIGEERHAEIGRGVVTADGLAGAPRFGDLAQHGAVGLGDARKVHHLAKADDVGPGHRLAYLVGAKAGAGILKPGRARNATWHLHEHVDGEARGLVVHQPNAGKSKHVADLVRVDEHARGAMRDDGAGELGRRNHAALDVHVAVAQARHEITAGGVDERRCRSDGVTGRADDRKSARGDRDVGIRDDLAGIDVDPTAVTNDEIGRRAPGRDIDKLRDGFGPRLQIGGRHASVDSGAQPSSIGR